MGSFKTLIAVLVLCCVFVPKPLMANSAPPDKTFYRDLVLSLRKSATLTIPTPGIKDNDFTFTLEFDKPLWPEPGIGDISVFPLDPSSKGKFHRQFFDKILLKDGSMMIVNGEEIPLTCVFVNGQDNRFAGNPSPLFPQFVMKVYLVANDFACQGPIRPGWPNSGGKEQAWDTYIYYEIRDPTVMLPTEVLLRYRWNEFGAVLKDAGAVK